MRIYQPSGRWSIGQFSTGKGLIEVDTCQDFYTDLTGCKALLEGMSIREHQNVPYIQEAFRTLWRGVP